MKIFIVESAENEWLVQSLPAVGSSTVDSSQPSVNMSTLLD